MCVLLPQVQYTIKPLLLLKKPCEFVKLVKSTICLFSGMYHVGNFISIPYCNNLHWQGSFLPIFFYKKGKKEHKKSATDLP